MSSRVFIPVSNRRILFQPMIEDQPSRTAQRVAMRRALHQIWDHPKVFDDPVALRIVGHDSAEDGPGAKPTDSAPDRSLRAFLVARSRYAEDQLALSVARGVKQYVVLGAGLDTFAFRNPFAEVRVFEVDHPATQAWKRRRLDAAGITLPPSLTFAPVDFQKDTLAHGLESAGFERKAPAFFAWLGVTPYLARETVLATLRWIITACPHNGVVFDFAVPPESLRGAGRIAFDELAGRVAAAGEPFVSFFDPQEMDRDLHAMGFTEIETLGGEEINARYFRDRTDGLRVRGQMGRLTCARG